MSPCEQSQPEMPETPAAFDPISLCEAGVGVKLRVRSLNGSEKECHRLREMGFCEWMDIQKLTNGGNMICNVCGTRLALSKNLARGIMVEKA